MTNYSIVRAEHRHLNELAPLFNEYRIFYHQPPDVEAARKFLKDRLSNLESVIFFAKSEQGQGMGFTQLYPSFSSVRLCRLWILYDIFVAPYARRIGVGRDLMAAAHQFAADSGAKIVELSTAKDNYPAQALYESLGYERDIDFLYYELVLSK